MPDIRFRTQGAKETERDATRVAKAFELLKENALDARQQAAKTNAVSANADFRNAQRGGGGGGANLQVEQLTAYESRLGAIAGLLGNFDSQLGATVQTVADASGALEGASEGFKSLRGGAAAAGVAMAAVTAVFLVLQKVASDVQKSQERYIQALQDFGNRERLIRQYSQQVNEEFLVSEQARLQAERDIIEAQIENNEKAVKLANEQLGILKAPLDLFGVDTDPAEKNLEDLRRELQLNNDALDALNSEETRRAVQLREQLAAMQAEYDLRVLLIGQIENLTVAEAERAIRIREQEIAIREQQRSELASDLLGVPPEQVVAATGLTLEQVFDSLRDRTGDTATAFRQVDDQIKTLTQNLEIYKELAIPAAQANDALAESTKALTDSQARLKDVNEQLADIANRRADAEDALANERARQNTEKLRDFIVETYEARIAEAKAAEEQAAKEQELLKVREQSSREIVDIQRNLTQDLRELESDYMQSRADLINDYYAQTLEALEDYQIEESRRTEDYNRERLRQIQDLYGDLSDAALDNDIKRFLEIQKEGEKSLQRSAEDQDIETRRRAEDFARQQQQARAQFEAQLADLQAQFEIERATRQQEAEQRIIEVQQQAARELELVRQSGQQKLSESQRLEAQLANLRNQFRIQDEQQARQLRLQGLQLQLQDLAQQEAAIIKIRRDATIALAESLASAARASVPNANNLTGGSTTVNVTVDNLNTGSLVTPTELNNSLNNLTSAVTRAFSTLAQRLAGG